jgi:hypothetical protein
MNKEKQRIAIAEACPATFELNNGRYKTPFFIRYRASGHECDPLTDLNAMHEAEKTLTDEQIARWQRDLWLTCENDFYALEACAPPIVLRRFISATAAQRAEAFLRTIGKWEDDK